MPEQQPTHVRPTLTTRKPPRTPFYLVWSPTTSRVRRRHATEADAWAEARRLRKANPERHYVVCMAVGVVGVET